jgi:hypothetical protein
LGCSEDGDILRTSTGSSISISADATVRTVTFIILVISAIIIVIGTAEMTLILGSRVKTKQVDGNVVDVW